MPGLAARLTEGVAAVRAHRHVGRVIPVGLAALGALMLQLARLQLRRARRLAQDKRLREAFVAVRSRLPTLAQLGLLGEAVLLATGASRRLARGADRLAGVLRGAGAGLFEAAGAALAGCDEEGEGGGEEGRAIEGYFEAWQNVGQATDDCAARLLEAHLALEASVGRLEARRAGCLEQASELELALVRSETELRLKMRPRVWLLSWLGPRLSEDEATLAKDQLHTQWTMTGASLERLTKEMADLKNESQGVASRGVMELRQLSKPLGERLILLRPGPRAATSFPELLAGSPATVTTREVGAKVRNLMQSMTTADGRQNLRVVEAAEEASRATLEPPPQSVVPMPARPLEERDGEWRISGVYKHQVLKAGLRRLDENWPALALLEFPQAGLMDVGRGLMRESLFREMLSGSLRLQSVPVNDVAAAQRDLERLSLRQLLRLRVHHLDFTPSGCGADTISTVGSTHEAFLTKLDARLFEQLGRKAVGKFAQGATQFHRLGLEAVFFASAASSLSTARLWCWWLADDRRVYFDPAKFEAFGDFPASDGVLEVTDYSKVDRHEPTGRLQWLDWRIRLVTEEALLVAGPLGGGAGGESAGVVAGNPASEGAWQGAGADSTAASGLSEGLLQRMRGGLRKVEGRPAV
mmetsp:Transcript_117289/g.373635  ORF Transcript_117289/g.373635 Transcript_117289/m.373635 type:complete len:641 (+) Transcript_117289:88-2010(+)